MLRYKGSQCHSTTAKEDSATVQLQRKTVPQYNCKGRQCHSAATKEEMLPNNYKGSWCQYKSVPHLFKGSQCHSTTAREASVTVHGKPLPQYEENQYCSTRQLYYCTMELHLS